MRPALLILLWLLPVAGCTAPPVANEKRAAAPTPYKLQASRAVPRELNYFLGTWRVTARDPASGEVLKILYKVEPAVGGKWLAGHAESSDLKVQARDSWGIDPASGNILRFVFDGSGAYGIVRASGWQGSRLILEGEAQSRGGSTKVRETITRAGPDRFDAVWESLQDGSWKAYSIEQATRQ